MKKSKECACKEEWLLQPKHLNELVPYLLNDEFERSGAILFETTGQPKSSRVILNSAGNTGSVVIRPEFNHLISFHTHPATAYIQAGCVYGHPSGDDLVEFARLAQSNSILNHMVFSFEAIYIVQVHPRFAIYLRELPKNKRDDLFEKLFNYFRKFHGKRSLTNVRRTGYGPEHFIHAVNTFKLDKIVRSHGYTHSKMFLCRWYPSSHYEKYKGKPDKLWQRIVNRNLKVAFGTIEQVVFNFLDLNEEERTLSNVRKRFDKCLIKHPR